MGTTLTLNEDLVYEELVERGWTDGLPVVPPTPDRVRATLDAVGAEDPELLVGYLPSRRRGVSLEKAAINAVMAGARPEYFPVILAALEAMFDPAFNLHGAITSSGGATTAVIVSGAIAAEIGMNAGHSALGQGNRANATIGRALRLVTANVLGSKIGEIDATSIGHPGRFTLCFAESEPPEPWRPVRVEEGYAAGDTTVTVSALTGPQQLAQMTTRSAEEILRSFARSISSPAWYSTGKRGQGVLVLGPEHAGFCVEQGWTQQQVREFVVAESRICLDDLVAAGVHPEENSANDMTPAADGTLPSLDSPESLLLVTAGGHGAGWSAWIPAWAPVVNHRRVTRRVRPTGEELPPCGPDGCLVPWMR